MMGRQSRQMAMVFVDMASLIPENHLLRKIDGMVSFDFIYGLLAPYYSATGRPSVDPVSMFKMLLVGYLYGIKSERRLVEEIRLNIAYRWFCGFELDDAIPDHSTFSKTRTRKWQQSGLFQNAFYEIVKQCIACGLIDGKAMAADGSYIPANVSRESWVDVETEVEQSMQSYLDALDEELSQQPGFKKPPERTIKKRRTTSRTDPDSGYINHGNKRGIGYLMEATVDCKHGILTGVDVYPANEKESLLVLRHLEQQIKLGVPMNQLALDRGYDTGAVHRGLELLGVTGYIPAIQFPNAPEKYGFSYNPQRDAFICPEGVGLTYHRLNCNQSTGKYLRCYQIEDDACKHCVKRPSCFDKAGIRRRVLASSCYPAFFRGHQRVGTPEFLSMMRLRKIWAEGSFSVLKREHCISKIRKRGILAATEECLLAAMALNLKRMASAVFFYLHISYSAGTTAGFGSFLAFVNGSMLVHYLSDSLQSAAGYLMFAEKRMELGGHLRKLPMGYFTSGNIGKISSVLSTDMVFIEEVAMSTLGNMMSYLLSSLVLLGFMFYLNWQLGLIAALVTILAWLVSRGMNKVSLREAAGRQEQSERLTDAVLSFVEGIGVIKSYNLLGEKSEELTGNFKRSRNTSLAFERKMTPWTMGLNVLYGIGIAAIFGLSVFLERSGVLSLAYVLGVLLFVFDLFGPLKALYGEASRLTVMNAALDRIEAVLDEPELPDTGKQHIPAQAQPGQPEVQFNDVAFAYQDKEVLHHISFSMFPNSMTALVGPSGGGKSTIANLLARLWDVKSGSVAIRGVDTRQVPLAELMDHISMVFQRVYLFQDTIYNNISMGKPNATEEEVYEAARKARCYDFIMALPDGFQTVVGEGGATLSGGEKQRISIARCILKDAPIVILDEATASVDTDNESYIQEAISELVKGKTLLVIAHRLNTIQNADQILVISDGHISQHGTHEELMEQPGIYQDFVRIRMNSAGWSLS